LNLTNEYRGVNSQSTNVMFEFTKCGLLVLMSINNIKTGRILLRLQLPGVIGRQGPGCVIMFANVRNKDSALEFTQGISFIYC